MLADILKRDERDQNRASGAAESRRRTLTCWIIRNLDIEGGVRAAIAIVEAVRARQRDRA